MVVDGYEWGLELTRARGGQEVVEYHRFYNEPAARIACREEQRRIGQGIVKTVEVHLVKRPVGDWERVSDE